MIQDVRTANTVFANLPHGAEGHFLLHFYAVIAQLLAHLRTMENGNHYFEQFPFLAGYQATLRSYVPGELPPAMEGTWWDAQIAQREAQTAEQLPIRTLITEAGLSVHEVRVLIAAGIVEEDIRFGALFASLQEPLTARRPCMGVLGWLLGEPGTDIWQACRTLLDSGLLHVENPADPRTEWILRVPAAIWDALRGQPSAKPAPGLTLQTASDFPLLDDLILPETLHSRILHLPDLLASGQVTALVLRGMNGSGRRTALGAIARTLKRNVLLWEDGKPGDDTWRLLGPLATLVGAIPVLRCDPAPGETLDLPALPGYTGPVGITLGRSGGLRGPLIAHSLSLTLPSPDRNARRRFWQATHVPILPDTLDDITTSFLLTGGYICKAATLAQAYAVLDNRSAITVPDVQQATRALNRQALETLATALEPTHGWADLVVSSTTADELRTLEARCRGREVLREHAGPALKQSLNRGVRALFSGPSGTGKTLAARALAAALQMDLYRVDLAAVVNKYIGETERNLNQVFSRAEELDVVLLLDEGDALMTNRTDVRNANDRYANLETNYLLQRLETYEGIVVITTNAGNRIDSAFLRRIDVLIDFAPPEASERWRIWQSHLPLSHTVSAAFLEEVAGRCVLTGGQIRNAALHATLLASGNAGQVGDTHLEAAVQREYRKAAATCPLRPRTATKSQIDRLREFSAELR
jgi:ATPase family associated with various cellular activities (AAA)